MNDIAKNLKFCFDISKFKSMSQFCKVIGIDKANLSKKMSESNLLREQVADLRKQVESKDAQIKQLMDLLAKK